MVYILTFLFFLFRFGSSIDENEPVTDPTKNIYYFIVEGNELDNCNQLKKDIESGTCDPENIYLIVCENSQIICQENDDGFPNVQSNSSMNIYIGSGLPSINLSKLPILKTVFLFPYSMNNEEVTTKLTLKGGEVNNSLYIFGLIIKIEESSLLFTNDLHLFRVQIEESNFFIHSENLSFEDLSIPDDYPVLCNNIQIACGIAAEITFTNNEWIINHITDEYNSELDEVTYINRTVHVPYNYGNKIYLLDLTYVNNITFKVDDNTNAKLKSVIIDFNNVYSPIIIIQTGKWEPPLVGPLNVYMLGEEGKQYTFDELLDQEWFNFVKTTDIPSFPPNVDDDTNNTPNTSDNGDEDDTHNPPPDVPTTPETTHYSYNIVIANDNEVCNYVKSLIDECKKNPDSDSECISFANAKDCQCTSNKQSVNNLISNVDDEIDFLNIVTDGDISIDLNRLKKPVTVSILGYLPFSDEESKHLLSNHNKIIKKKVGKESDDDDEEGGIDIVFPRVEIQGNIRYSVPFLHALFIDLDVKGSPLNIENLMLSISMINSNSQAIQVDNLITDESSHLYIIEKCKEKIKVKQYSTSDSFFAGEQFSFKISFEQDRWDLLYSFGDDFIPFYKDSPSYVPYSFCERLAMIQFSENFDLFVKDATIKNLKPVNISIFDIDKRIPVTSAVSLSTTGNWDGITDPVSLYFTSNKETTLDSKECNSKVKIERFYFGEISSSAPPTVDDTKKNNTNIGEVDISSNKTPESINDAIKEKFDSAEIDDDKKNDDKIVTIKNDKKEESIPIKDLELAPDQFVKFENDAKIDYESGTLNLALDEDFKQVNINIKNENDVALTIKNKKDCTIKINAEAQDNQLKTITINSNSEVYGTLNFEAQENVKEIVIESIKLHESGSVKSNVPITVNNIAALPQTTGKLTKVTVSKDIVISQTASLELDDDVSLESANLNLNLQDFNPSNYKYPMLKGKLRNPPKTIKLTKSTDDSNVDNLEYLLFQGSFTDKCENWKNIIDYGNSGFNDGACSSYNPAAGTLDESMSLKVFKKTDNNGGNGPSGGKGGDNKGLKPGEIAGIVIGCILAVAIVVIVVVFVIKKKKNNQQSSEEAPDDQQNDL